jgi:hypothetical protein
MPNQLAPKYYFMDYLFLQAIASCFWLLVHWTLDFVFMEQNPRYLKKNLRESYEYRGNICGMFHALIATFLAFYCIFYACGEGNNFFNSEECADNPRNITIYTVIFSGAYFLIDLVLLVYYTKCKTIIYKQYALHHTIGWVLLTLPLITQDYFTVASAAFMTVEVSAAFPNLRYLLFQHGYTNKNMVVAINSILLAITFLFGRMPLLIFLILFSARKEVFGVYFNPA